MNLGEHCLGCSRGHRAKRRWACTGVSPGPWEPARPQEVQQRLYFNIASQSGFQKEVTASHWPQESPVCPGGELNATSAFGPIPRPQQESRPGMGREVEPDPPAAVGVPAIPRPRRRSGRLRGAPKGRKRPSPHSGMRDAHAGAGGCGRDGHREPRYPEAWPGAGPPAAAPGPVRGPRTPDGPAPGRPGSTAAAAAWRATAAIRGSGFLPAPPPSGAAGLKGTGPPLSASANPRPPRPGVSRWGPGRERGARTDPGSIPGVPFGPPLTLPGAIFECRP